MKRHHLRVALAATTALALAGAVFYFTSEPRLPPSHNPPTIRERPEASPFAPYACGQELERAANEGAPSREAVCGRLRLPESPGSRRTIEVGVIRLRPRRATKLPPLLFVPGGPGDSFSHHLARRLPLFAPLAGDREILILDQRGVGTSVPRLDCRRTLKRKEDLADCFRSWNADLNVASFSTTQAAVDVALVLQALGVPQVAVYGVSYGTRIGLELASAHPHLVEKLLVDSPVPRSVDVLGASAVHAQGGFERLAELCRVAPSCRAAHGFELSDLARLATEMNQKEAGSGKKFLSDLGSLASTTEVLPFVPLMIAEARRGQFALFQQFRDGFSGYEFSRGLHLSVQCAEFVPQMSHQAMAQKEGEILAPFAQAFSSRAYFDQCAEWAVPPAVLHATEAKVTVPTLVLSGGLDHVTPAAYGEKVLETLTSGRYLVIESASHGAALSPCGAGVAARFFQEGLTSAAPPLAPCVSEQIEFSLSPPDDGERKTITSRIRYRL